MASRTLAVLAAVLLAAVPAMASGPQTPAPAPTPAQSASQGQTAAQAQPPAQATPPAQAKPTTEADKKKEADKAKAAGEQAPKYEEQIVVTASKVEQQLINAPATVSVISAQTLASTASQDFAGLFRAVPGVNVSQTSARDVNITSRGATSTLSTTQLALIDGRSIYLDFFGFIGWDFMPINFAEIKQVEVIRGPASAVWGANAMTGVVNIITKSPREMQGTTLTMGAGTFNRDVKGQATAPGNGGVFYTNLTHARAINDRWSYKVSAAFYGSDPFSRPVGNIPNGTNTPYPSFGNTGTEQPKVDGRVDYDFADGKSKLTFAGGYAGTSGIIHTGIGPFRIEKGTNTSYVKGTYTRGALRAQFFSNILDGKAPALLAIGVDGKPINFLFNTKTYDFDLSNISTVGTRHVFSYGGNIRHNAFDLSIAPGDNSRNEQGVYLQDEMFLSEKWRWLVGGRLDHFDVLSKAVFSPRTTLMFKPAPAHTFRVSYNQAYRAPSLTNNFLDVTILNQMDLGALSSTLAGRTYIFPTLAQGNKALTEQSLKAYEIGYSGVIKNRVSVSAAWYYNDMKNEINFTQDAGYSSKNVPPGWPLPPSYLDLIIASGKFGTLGLPSHYTYLNFSKIQYQGVELGFDAQATKHVQIFANYSWQPDPTPDASIPISEVNIAPHNRFNAGLNFSAGRFFGDVALTYQDEAYWQDVLDARYSGWTDAFSMLNAGFGAKFMNGRLITSVKATNLANQQVMQHIFGDVMKRSVVGEVKIGLF